MTRAVPHDYGATVRPLKPLKRPRASERHHAQIPRLGILSAAATVVLVASLSFRSQPSPTDRSALSGLASSHAFVIRNEYAVQNPAASSFYPWAGVTVEPWRETTLSLTDIDKIPTEATISWEISRGASNRTGELLASGTGKEIVVTFRHAGQWHDVLARIRVPGRDESQLTSRVMCKYVRREVRSLNSEDQERLLTALEVVHRTTLSVGQETYGARFRNYEYFTSKHLWQMTIQKCTAWHGGDVFVTSHAAFTLELEQALQAIDPRVSVPFWDYTLDDHEYVDEWRTKSPILSAQWFGGYANASSGVAGPTSQNHAGDAATTHAIDSGHFAYIPVPTSRMQGSHPEQNSYGIITDAMNNNPSPFVTRVDSICGLPSQSKLPGCKELKGAIGMKDLSGFRAQVEYIFHGVLHMQIGGVDGCAASFREKVEQYPHWASILEAIGLSLNTMWRSMMNLEMLRCPKECGADVPFEMCSCSCPSYDHWVENMTFVDLYTLLNSNGGNVMQMLQDGVVSGKYILTDDDYANATTLHFANLTMTEDQEFMRFLLEVLCHPGRMSQFATPLAAPNDPLFWPVHATFDRLWAFMRTAPSKSFDDSWNDDGGCAMHGYHDLLPFGNFNGQDSSESHMTNQELYQYFDPKNPSLPYVYEDFEWAHCDADGAEGTAEEEGSAEGSNAR